MERAKLHSFLKLGYFIDYKNPTYQLDYSQIDRKKYLACSEQELINIGISAFRKGVERNFTPNQIHVLPLSGGLDGRAILAVLLEFTSASNIHTYTFGTPGTFDYEIGNLIARIIGTNHVVFTLTEYNYHQEELLDISKRVDHQTVLFHHPPIWELDKRFKGAQVWSGYIGDVITGGYYQKKPSPNITKAKERYLEKYAYVNSISLTDSQDQHFYDYIDYQWLDSDIMSYDEQVIYQERQLKLTAPHVLMKGYQYHTPFINNEFMNFMFSIPGRYRKNQYLYKKILLEAYPKLFRLKTKNYYGLSLNAPQAAVLAKRTLMKSKRICNKVFPVFMDKNINYLDFDSAIREKENLKSLFYQNLMDLKQRNLLDWVPIEKIWRDHISGRGRYSDALIVLVSLEIHLKATNYHDFPEAIA